MKIKEIIERPSTHGNVHESIFRCYATLQYVLEMVYRGDSKETILEMAEFLRSYPSLNSK